MKQVLITGATSGIGTELALAYANADYHVFACGRNQQQLDKLSQQSSQITPLKFDLTDRNQVLAMAEQIAHLDHLILNAGNCEYMDDVQLFDSVLFERVMTINVLAIGYCLEAFLSKVVASGQVGLVSSSATYLPFTRAEAYGASKAAVNYLARSLSVDLAPQKIGVSLIQPGFVETPLTAKNNFAMPAQVSASFSATKILKGMQSKKLHIRFPSFFIFCLQCMSCMPFWLWRRFAISMVNK